MQRYFVSGDKDNINFCPTDIFHIRKVMRFRVDDKLEIVLNQAVYLAKIVAIDPLDVAIVEEISENRELNNHVTLIYCLPKGDKLDLVVQKATELGVYEIIGVISSRTIIRLDEDDKKKKTERYQKIIKEAAEQSKRRDIPLFSRIIAFSQLSELTFDYKFIAYENEALQGSSLFNPLTNIKRGQSIGILIGPEGGFSHEEVEKANADGYQNISLGKRILRSETAAICALGNIAFMLERN